MPAGLPARRIPANAAATALVNAGFSQSRNAPTVPERSLGPM